MRVIKFSLYLLIFASIFNGCRKPEQSANLEAINAYVETVINNRKYDMRLYDPPPPRLKDSLKHNGRMKPDSIIKNLKPLKEYVNFEIKYDTFLLADIKPIKGFNFIKNSKSYTKSIFLDTTSFSKKEGIILRFLSSKDFFSKNKEIEDEDDYGEFISFRNLYSSYDGKKTVFELFFYKNKLNASAHIVYAEKEEDGTWKFTLDMIAIS